MNNLVLLGLDIGTSGAKAVVVDQTGRLLGKSGREYPIHTPNPGWAEQDPADWISAVLACARDALAEARVDGSSVAAVGLAGQMHSLVCLGSDGEPLRPAILWADQRSALQVERLTRDLGRDHLAAWTGNPLAAGFQLASWAWLAENEPETARRARLLILPKDYTRYRLTGAVGTEPSDASSTLLFDPARRDWSAPLLHAVGIDPSLLPPIFPSHTVAGGLLPEIARAVGLRAGTPVIFGGSDVSMQALALGLIHPGTASCTIGTGGQIFSPTTLPAPDPALRLHLFCHALPGLWHHEAAILTAGLCLRWLRDSAGLGADYDAMTAAAAPVEAALDGLFFLPFLTGERTPYMNPRLQAGFVGLGLRHGSPHMIRAVMEGVAFALREGLSLIEALGGPVERLLLSGGASNSPLWRQILADVFNRPLFTADAVEATARGAALLAGIGVGVYTSAEDALRQAVTPPRLAASPAPSRAGRYDKAFAEYHGWAEVFDRKTALN